MSGEPALVLEITELGKAELHHNGRTLWASDSDPDVLDALQTDYINDDEHGDTLVFYLIDAGVITKADARELVIDSPLVEGAEDDDDDEDEDDADEEDEEDDEDDEEDDDT